MLKKHVDKHSKRRTVCEALTVVIIFLLIVGGILLHYVHGNERATQGFNTTEYATDCRRDINRARFNNDLNSLEDNKVDDKVATKRSAIAYRNLVDLHQNNELGAHSNHQGARMMSDDYTLPEGENVMVVRVGHNDSHAESVGHRKQTVHKFVAQTPKQLASQTVDTMMSFDKSAGYGHRENILNRDATSVGVHLYLSHARNYGTVVMEFGGYERGMVR